MAYVAKIENDVVTEVNRVLDSEIENWTNRTDEKWLQTSYNTRGNVHYGPDGKPDGGKAIRANWAGIGTLYDPEHDVFYPTQPYPSWTLNTNTWLWEPPVPYPNEYGQYVWDEQIKNWVNIL